MPADIPAFSEDFDAEPAWKRAGAALPDQLAARLSGLARCSRGVGQPPIGETRQRGFILTGDEPFLVRYTFATQQLNARWQRLAYAAKDDAAESASVQEITRGARAKMDELAQTIQRRRHDRTGKAMTIVREGRGRRLMVAIRAEATRMLAREATRLREREREAAVGRRRLTTIVGSEEPFQLSVSAAHRAHDPQVPVALDALMESADRAMYEKKRGRSRPPTELERRA